MLFCKVRFLSHRFVLLLSVWVCCLLIGCVEEPPLKVGFIGGLTGRVADLGVAGRDGVIYAVNEKNNRGGIAGRPIELIVRDDKHDAEVARQMTEELINEGVIAIIGPMTSSIGVVVQPVVDAGKTTTVSPTVKTDQLSGQDDYFLRVTAPLSRNAERVAIHATGQLGLQKFAVVYDASNRAFTETWLSHFRNTLAENNGEVIIAEEFKSEPDVHYLPIAKRLLENDPDGVLFLSNAIDTAMLAQQLRKLGSDVPLFSSEWAFTTDLISFGGHAVDGMISFHSFNANDNSQEYLSFKKGFTEHFGYSPSFATVLAYDAATFLFKGLERTTERAKLRDALLEMDTFQGLQSKISIDEYGDVERQLFLTVVEDGAFKVVK